MGCLFSLESLGWRGRGEGKAWPDSELEGTQQSLGTCGVFRAQGGSKRPLPRLVLGSVAVAFPFFSLIATQREQSVSWTVV